MTPVRTLGAGLAAFAAAVLAPTLAFAESPTPDAALVERGRYLVTTSGCHDCHTPLKMTENGPEPDMSRMLSGHPESFAVSGPPVNPGDEWLMVTTIVEDPRYLTQRFIVSNHFRREAQGGRWDPRACGAAS